jgi:superfamily II DNA helicase RecQ
MPTGLGKSLHFLLPVSYEFSATTIVIIPLIALRDDLIRRTKELGILCRVWQRDIVCDGVRLIFVTPEAALSLSFLTFLHRLRTT